MKFHTSNSSLSEMEKTYQKCGRLLLYLSCQFFFLQEAALIFKVTKYKEAVWFAL